jgi:hypothetical protein
MRRRMVLESSEEGGFTAYAPALPGGISEGETQPEALANIRRGQRTVSGASMLIGFRPLFNVQIAERGLSPRGDGHFGPQAAIAPGLFIVPARAFGHVKRLNAEP